jgi:hypothetical protein
MKPIDYPDNGRGLMVQYHVMREGPNYFMVHYKGSSVLRQDPKDAWRVTGVAKFTEKAQQLKQWCIDTHDEWNKKKEESRKDTSFASEAQVEEEPNDNTKMIT